MCGRPRPQQHGTSASTQSSAATSAHGPVRSKGCPTSRLTMAKAATPGCACAVPQAGARGFSSTIIRRIRACHGYHRFHASRRGPAHRHRALGHSGREWARHRWHGRSGVVQADGSCAARYGARCGLWRGRSGERASRMHGRRQRPPLRPYPARCGRAFARWPERRRESLQRRSWPCAQRRTEGRGGSGCRIGRRPLH